MPFTDVAIDATFSRLTPEHVSLLIERAQELGAELDVEIRDADLSRAEVHLSGRDVESLLKTFKALHSVATTHFA